MGLDYKGDISDKKPEQYQLSHPPYHTNPPTIPLIIIKHQRPNLNTLSRLPPFPLPILKRRMRHPSRAPIIHRIKALDKQRLVGPLRVLEIPLVLRVGLDSVRLAGAVGVDERDGDEIAVGDGVGGG